MGQTKTEKIKLKNETDKRAFKIRTWKTPNSDLLPISGQVVSLAFGGPQGIFVVGYWLHSGRRKCSRSQVSKATVRSRGVIVGPPRIELYFSIFDRPEQLQVQAFVAQARIEAFNEAVLHRFSSPNEVNPDPA